MKKFLYIVDFNFFKWVVGHHWIPNYNLKEDVEFIGIIGDVAFINPHSWVYIVVLNDYGSTSVFQCEMGCATVLRRSDWSSDMFQISVVGSPGCFEKNVCYMGN